MLRSAFGRIARNITCKESWEVHLPLILQAIRHSEFVSIDLELTGLHEADNHYVGIDRCYEAHCHGAKSFMPLQVGICAARRSEHKRSHWILTPASMYLYPRDGRNFMASTSTLSFLRDNNFDFNSWISEGLAYMRPKDEQETRALLERRIRELEELRNASQGNDSSSRGIEGSASHCVKSLLNSLRKEDLSEIAMVRQQIDAWLAADLMNPNNEERASLDIPVDNAFQRLIIHAMISQQYSGVYSHSVKRGKERYVSMHRSEDKVFDRKISSLYQELEILKEAVGVRRIFDEISLRKKPIVGHNCFYDFLHLQQTFYEELPDNVAMFKELWTSRFPVTFDTKYLCEAHEQLSLLNPPNTLEGLCDYMAACSTEEEGFPSNGLTFEISSLPGTFWRPPGGATKLFQRASDVPREHHTGHYQESMASSLDELPDDIRSEKLADVDIPKNLSHEAGFDSMMTSVIFILQCSKVLKSKRLSWDNTKLSEEGSNGTMMEILSLMANRIRLVKTQPNVIFLNSKDEDNMSRHFLMTGYPAHWKKWELLKIWHPIPVSVSILDATSSWIVCRNEDDARSVLKMYAGRDKSFKLVCFG